MLRSGIQQGRILHRRSNPKHHSFAYPLFMSLLDVDEIPDIFSRTRLWSMDRFNLVSFRRKDYIGGKRSSIKNEVKRRILENTGETFEGRVFMLAHMQYLGFCFNPVSFYFCYEDGQTQPSYILAEINNTPWNERYCYVLSNKKDSSCPPRHIFPKQFHVSPFMPMNLEYHWRFDLKPDRLEIEMSLYEDSTACFEARLELESRPFTAANMRRIPLRYPFMTAAVVFRIYWQALRLRLKRVPIHDHPKPLIDEVKYEYDS